MDGSVFLDDIIDNYYCNIGIRHRSSLRPGQIVWTYSLYNYENLEFWRPHSFDETSTRATSFEICSSAQDLFNRQIPLISPRLEIDEEFIVIKAKKRPAILITLPPPEVQLSVIRGGGKVNLKLCLLAPLFSIENAEGKTKYNLEFVNRVRKLQYPHFFFIPEYAETNIRNSLCRFDRIFSTFRTHLEPKDLCLTGEASDIFFSQLQSYLTGTIEGSYQVAYETLNQ